MDKFKIEVKRSSWPGWGSAGGPGHNIKVFCNNRLLADVDNLSEVEESELLKRWEKLSCKSGFAKLLAGKPQAFPLCHFCKIPLVAGSGSVWDIEYCKDCYAKVEQYSKKKQAELNQYQLDQDRKIAEDNEKRRMAVQLRLEQLRTGTFVGKNQRGEFWIGNGQIAFVPYKAEWEHEIIVASTESSVKND